MLTGASRFSADSRATGQWIRDDRGGTHDRTQFWGRELRLTSP